MPPGICDQHRIPAARYLPVLVPQHRKYTIQISTKFLSEILLVQVGSQSIQLVLEPSETAKKRLYLNVYSCVWRKRWLCSSGHTRSHHRIIVWPVQTFRSGRFLAILGYFRRFWWRNGYPRRFWWSNGSETAKHKYAPLWTSGPIF